MADAIEGLLADDERAPMTGSGGIRRFSHHQHVARMSAQRYAD